MTQDLLHRARVRAGTGELSFRPLAPTLGAVVEGVDLSSTLERPLRRALYEAFLIYGALLFEGQALSVDDEESAFACFDGIDAANLYGKEFRIDGHPAVRVLSNIVTDEGRLGIVMGKQGPEWHCDGTSSQRQPIASQLYCLEANEVGGDTLFADGSVAFETLPPEVRARLEPMVAVYNSDHLQQKLSVYDQREIALSGAASVEHPVVLTHPETGRKALYFSGGEMTHIHGLSEDDRLAVVELLSTHLLEHPHLAYRHHWRPGDLFVWDNRRVIHSATFYDYEGHPRLLHHLCGSGEALAG